MREAQRIPWDGLLGSASQRPPAGTGEEGGQVVVAGTPMQVAASRASRTAPHLAGFLTGATAE